MYVCVYVLVGVCWLLVAGADFLLHLVRAGSTSAATLQVYKLAGDGQQASVDQHILTNRKHSSIQHLLSSDPQRVQHVCTQVDTHHRRRGASAGVGVRSG